MKTMTRKFKWNTCFSVTVVAIIAAALMLSGPAMAADNVGTGDIGGDSASLNSSNTFSLFTTIMSLNKMAFLSNGTQLVTGSTLPRGTEVRFVVYVDNTTTFPLSDVSIQDVMDPAFGYISGSMKASNAISTGASQAFIYSTVNAVATTLSDLASSADVASYASSTIDVGNQSAANSTLDVNPTSVWAIMFRALMQ